MGWTKNRWVRMLAIALVVWAALDAAVSLLSALFPGHFNSHGLYRQSTIQQWVQPYWSTMYPRDRPNLTRLFAVLRYGVTILVCVVIMLDLRVRVPNPN